MKEPITQRGKYRPFHTLRQIGFSVTRTRRFERLRRKHEHNGRSVCVLAWPDGIWCVLIMHTEKFDVVVLGDAQKTDAYHGAHQMIRDGYSPVLTLRHERHA